MNQVIVNGVIDVRYVDGQLHLPAGRLCSVEIRGELEGAGANVTANVTFRPGVTARQADAIVETFTRTLREQGVTVRGAGGQTSTVKLVG